MDIKFYKESLCDDYGQMLVCPNPECDDYYVHFKKSKYIEGFDDHQAWEGRGSSIEIDCFCEHGHEWTIRFGLHKGQTYLKIINLRQGIIG